LTGVANTHGKGQRSFGNKAFDWIFYPLIAFGVVGAASVASLYYSKFGNPAGTLNRFYAWSKSKLGPADILISFATGTILLTPIKLLEDKRAHIADWFDRMNTKYRGAPPVDHSKEKAEPKQSWASIWGGRAAIFGFVLVVDRLFSKHIDAACRTVGSWVQKHPAPPATATFPITSSLTTKGARLAWAGTFEGLYTAICAAGVYVFSRSIAGFLNKKKDHPHPDSSSAGSGHMHPSDESGMHGRAEVAGTAMRPSAESYKRQPVAAQSAHFSDRQTEVSGPILGH